MYNKEQEFRAWLVEERKINPETITKDQNKKEFARFVEDYNTGMLRLSRLEGHVADSSSQLPSRMRSSTPWTPMNDAWTLFVQAHTFPLQTMGTIRTPTCALSKVVINENQPNRTHI